jgi:pfkB family carbohydrate kinase
VAGRYVAVGNPTLDYRGPGRLVLGGASVYAALQAARLGMAAAIVGRADEAELRPYWQPYAAEVAMFLQPAPTVTTFRNPAAGTPQRWLLEWAGLITPPAELPEGGILHLAPVAQEIDLAAWAGRRAWPLVCLTPQGLVRRWDRPSGRVSLVPYTAPAGAAGFADVVVAAAAEAPYLEGLLRGTAQRGGLAVVTHGSDGYEVLTRTGSETFPPHPAANAVDTTGAGDCFASALAVASYRGLGTAESLRLAGAAAAACVEGEGLTAVATLGEVRARLGGPGGRPAHPP